MTIECWKCLGQGVVWSDASKAQCECDICNGTGRLPFPVPAEKRPGWDS
jgi:DnaJ-class molecular chaperone